MCYEGLGKIRIAKHGIELLPSSSLVHSAPYGAGPTVRKLQQIENGKMLFQDVIKLARTEWATPIVLAPKKD